MPQATVLPYCTATITHGGSGSVVGALAHGLPMVLFPMGADQPRNARRCVELGVAEMLDTVTATPDDVHRAVTMVLEEPRYRQRAAKLQDEVMLLPPAADAVSLLERLAAERCPLVAPLPCTSSKSSCGAG